jgi:murein DD-endopeptidase MepM/ murein hydrolase activator NlpD
MRIALAALVLAAALVAGTAQADTFAVLPSAAPALPSLGTPNDSGSILVPPSFLTPPVAPMQLSYAQLLGIWQRAGAAYGIEWQVLAAINEVESNFGRNMGPSSAGAIGWMQFMPSTWLRWGTDANGDGVADPWNPDDAIFSAARYLAAAGGGSDLYRAVYAYNHADWYVQEVLGLADTLGADAALAFTIDRMQKHVDAARSAVVDASDALLGAQRNERRLAQSASRLRTKADRVPLLSDRLAMQARAGQIDKLAAVAEERVAVAERKLKRAQAALARAEQAAAGASLQQGTAQLMGAPSYADGYVFPVGGGPAVISVSHTHHDYPAADIAAPEGSPLYALADGSVVDSWTDPENRCGIGFTYRAFDGQVWTYCHMAVLDPSVSTGVELKAGAPVGLVGHTGHATGPHLHLQLQPASAWPQQEPWFQSFAGRSFAWSDAPSDSGETEQPANRALAVVQAPAAPQSEPEAAPRLAVQGPVFEVVPAEQAPVVLFSRGGS